VKHHTDAERGLVAALGIEDKVRLLTGADSWRTHGDPALGLRPMTSSDGPAGVRGLTLDERRPSTCLPCPSALGATWDTALVGEVAAALGAEARSKGIDILLAPTINLLRTPLGGRGFECFSEDPELTAKIAVAYVRGVQRAGVAATIKHFVGNDSETERWTYDVRVSEQVLRELYLVPFEACVREARAALVMAAYNGVNGSRMTEHGELLLEVLKGEWAFPGVVTSDWDATRSTVATAAGGLDLAMPGPNPFWGQALVDAVKEGQVAEEVIDDKVMRLLWVARQVRALTVPGGTDPGRPDGRPGPARPPVPELADPGLLRRAAAASFVLLRNERDTLPLDPAGLRRVAVVGPNAIRPVIQGGGSAVVIPVSVSAPADAIGGALAGRATVTAAPGCRTWMTVPPPAAGSVSDPETGESGLRLEFRAPDGTTLASEHRDSAVLAWWGPEVRPGVGWGRPAVIMLRARFRAGRAGPYTIAAYGVGRLVITVDGATIADTVTPVPRDPVEAMTRPGEARGGSWLAEGEEADVAVEFRPAADGDGPLTLRLGIAPHPDDDALLAEAVAAADGADAAVVVVGPADGSESEGFDRASLALPGRQDELIRRVAAVSKRTVVVVNSGTPVLMPWAGQAAAVLQAWLPGQAAGEALADVLLGHAEPGGRLPVTLPADEVSVPVLHAVPRAGRLDYSEGLLVGYRGYDAAGAEPAFPFGHGLGYTSWSYESLLADNPNLEPGENLRLRVVVRNTGPRAGREVVQAYLGRAARAPGRPLRVLAAFATVTAAPGEAAEVILNVPARVLASYDATAGCWVWPPGEVTVWAGRSSRDLPLTAAVRVT
jgi:beta-glucosidase